MGQLQNRVKPGQTGSSVWFRPVSIVLNIYNYPEPDTTAGFEVTPKPYY